MISILSLIFLFKFVNGLQRIGDCVQLENDQFIGLDEREFSLKDDFTFKYAVYNSRYFTVSYYPGYKVIKNLRHNETYVLTQCGFEEVIILNSFSNEENVKFFTVPLKNIAIADTTVNHFLYLLNVFDRVKYSSTYSVDSCGIKLSRECEKSFESHKNDVTIDGIFEFMPNSSNSKSIGFTASEDPSILGRYEWIKFLSHFFNKEFDAIKLYNEEKKEFFNIASPSKFDNEKKVIFMSYVNYKSEWNGVVYEDHSINIHFSAYIQEYIKKAGGNNMEYIISKASKFKKVTFSPNNYEYKLDIKAEFNQTVENAMFYFHHNVLKFANIVIDNSSPQALNVSYYMEVDMNTWKNVFFD